MYLRYGQPSMVWVGGVEDQCDHHIQAMSMKPLLGKQAASQFMY
jgi:hypothetical protein